MKFDSRYQEDNYYMKKALELAKLGIGAVNPNPLVGCIIVKEGKVIGGRISYEIWWTSCRSKCDK